MSTSSSQLTEGVKSTFAEHHAEIKRRANVNDAGHFDESTFERVESDAMEDPFSNSEQTFMVFSLSQKEFAPIPREPSNSGVCIYGAFETHEDAMEHAAVVRAQHPAYSILVDKTHTWIGAFTTATRMGDATYVNAKKKALLDAVDHERAEARKEFDANVADHQAGKTKTPTHKDEDVEIMGGEKTDRIARACRVEGQTLAVVSFVRDPSEDAEFLMQVYAFYESEDCANRYVRNVCGDRIRDHDIDVIKTCAWAFPQKMDGQRVRKEVYRASELNNVMLAHKKAPQDVERFKSEHQEYFTEAPPPSSERDATGADTGTAPPIAQSPSMPRLGAEKSPPESSDASLASTRMSTALSDSREPMEVENAGTCL
tara:strand:+ start:1472 stop:2584 length:1113 start_codon:yes stop_codon:yes gene_type:complete